MHAVRHASAPFIAAIGKKCSIFKNVKGRLVHVELHNLCDVASLEVVDDEDVAEDGVPESRRSAGKPAVAFRHDIRT